MSDLKIIFVAFSENTLGRQILRGIEEIGLKPVKAYMASEQAQKRDVVVLIHPSNFVTDPKTRREFCSLVDKAKKSNVSWIKI